MKQHSLLVEKTARYFSLGEFRGVKEVLFVCHGYAQLADEFLESFSSLQREGLLIIAPEGLHRFYARGAADKVVASWMTKVDRLDDIRDYVAFLDKTAETVLSEMQSPVKVSVLGFSQGAATVSRWAAMGKTKIDELILFCRKHLSPIKCPRSIDFEAELPRTPTGKLVKRHLRDRYWPKTPVQV